MFQAKCEKLVFKSYANSMAHIKELAKEIKNKCQIINHLLFSLENLTGYPLYNDLPLNIRACENDQNFRKVFNDYVF